MKPEEIDHQFSYQTPTEASLKAIQAIRESGRKFAQVINQYAPECADKTYAVRLIRMATMTANQAVTHNQDNS